MIVSSRMSPLYPFEKHANKRTSMIKLLNDKSPSFTSQFFVSGFDLFVHILEQWLCNITLVLGTPNNERIVRSSCFSTFSYFAHKWAEKRKPYISTLVLNNWGSAEIVQRTRSLCNGQDWSVNDLWWKIIAWTPAYVSQCHKKSS